ncbi:MAG: HAMP domain-containing protein [Chitinophaga sp.]|uniref:sensor histidine kinase n=1 Tax=Chitinophaga sp. TaxID=1869181 RepID=UPI0025C36292|nr:ATP-binding protein [Chitinophaga sp.]MBV8251975.1 HAMP domain-containing protein [Chitinophaga sp.]
MKLKTKYLLFISILHLLTLVLAWYVFKEEKVLFIVSELFILLSAVIAARLYRQLIRPLGFLMRGVDAIRERDFNVKFRPTGQVEMDQLILVYNQMIDELRKERTRQEQQHFFLEKLIHTSPTGIIILDYEDQVQQANPKALQLLETTTDNIYKRSIQDFQHPVWQEIAALHSGESRTITINSVSTYKIQKSHFVDRGFPRHFVMIEELTADILAAERKAYGKVIRMMAHEVNNTIGPVNSILQSVQQAQPEHASKLMLDSLQVAIDRNYSLNTFMRNFADVVRLPSPQIRQVNIHQLLEHVVALMQPTAAERKIGLHLSLPPHPLHIPADKQLLEQALINIIRNATESIGKEGNIRISLDDSHLTITDDGPGIPQDLVDQLFTPFFSSKKDGQGIGLTLVKEILLQHGFTFSLQTVAPRKTVFSIVLS